MQETLQTGQEPVIPTAAPETAVETSTDGTDGGDEEFTLDSVDRRYFGPDKLEEAEAYIQQVQTVCSDDSLKTNCKDVLENKATVPEGYGLAVIPIAKRQEGGKGNKVIGVAIAVMPDAAYVAGQPKGVDYITGVVQDSFMAKIANAVRPRDDGGEGTIPFTLEDFLTSMRGKESLKTFNELAPVFVKALRQKGMKSITPVILRQALQSAAFAEQHYGLVDQAEWLKVLDVMISKAKAKQLDPGVLVSWKETRNERETTEITSDLIDSALAALE